MDRTAIGRYRKEVRAIAGVKGGAKEAGRVTDVFNYGDMLFNVLIALPDDDASPDFELPNFDLSRLSSRSSLQS